MGTEQRTEQRTTRVWAHRGASGAGEAYAPENTLPAFQLAADMGADGVELDVQLTRDGEVVILHDERIDRTSDGSGWVGDYTLAELKRLNFSRTRPGYGFAEIPTLREFFRLMQGNAMAINIELKTDGVPYEGLEEKTWGMAGEMGMERRILYSSFSRQSLYKLRQIDPHARLALILGNMPQPGDNDALRQLGAVAVHPKNDLVTETYIRSCHRHGLAINAWTVDSPTRMGKLRQWGADGFFTNCPDLGRRCIDA